MSAPELVELLIMGGPQDGDTPLVKRELLEVGSVLQLTWLDPSGGEHVYRSAQPWSGRGKTVRLQYQGKRR